MGVNQGPVRDPPRRKPKNRKYPLSPVGVKQSTHVLWGTWLLGVGEELHHQAGEVPQMIRGMISPKRRKMRRMTLMKKLNQ